MRALRLEPDDVTYGQLLHVLSSSGRWAEALSVLQQIRRRNLRHYTSAIRACAQPDAPEFKGLETYRAMRAEGIGPDVHAYNVVLQSLRSAGDARAAAEALALYAEMTGEEKKGLGGRIVPDIVTFTHVISILARHGRHADALVLFSEGCRRKVLMQAALDSLWERDLSRLSYQLVRAAVDFALGEIVADYAAQRKAAAGSKEPNVYDLVLITGVDFGGAARSGVGGKQRPLPSPETRQGLAHLVLRDKGGGGYFTPGVVGGELRVGKEQLRRWLQDGAPP